MVSREHYSLRASGRPRLGIMIVLFVVMTFLANAGIATTAMADNNTLDIKAYIGHM